MRKRFTTGSGYQERQRAAGTPKKLEATYPSKDGLLNLPEGTGAKSEDRIVAENLDGLRTCFKAEIGRFKWEYGYQGRMEERVSLRNVRMQDAGKLFRSYLWLTCGEWSRGLKVGDVIAFNARVKNGKLTYPTNVRLIESANCSNSAPRTEASAIQIEMF